MLQLETVTFTWLLYQGTFCRTLTLGSFTKAVYLLEQQNLCISILLFVMLFRYTITEGEVMTRFRDNF